MSVKVMALVFDHYPAQGGELVLALALADHADHEGGGIFPAVPSLAKKTRQSERTVQYQLRKMEQRGWLECVERSAGGRNRTSRYRISPAWIEHPEQALNGAEIAPLAEAETVQHGCTVSSHQTVQSEAGNGATAVAPAVNRQEPSVNPTSGVFSLSGSAEPSDANEDQRLATWMLERIRRLNPKHREPNWRRWQREIRLLRQRDGHSLREIAELFAWANGDPFWQANILSPGKLREKWETLVLRRQAAGAAAKTGTALTGAAPDYRCAFRHASGERCGATGVGSAGTHSSAPWFCANPAHRDAVERQGEGIPA